MKFEEIKQFIVAAVLRAEEHEALESFKYKGKAVFNRHIDVDALLGEADVVDVRK
jgi:hypothetical protein